MQHVCPCEDVATNTDRHCHPCGERQSHFCAARATRAFADKTLRIGFALVKKCNSGVCSTACDIVAMPFVRLQFLHWDAVGCVWVRMDGAHARKHVWGWCLGVSPAATWRDKPHPGGGQRDTVVPGEGSPAIPKAENRDAGDDLPRASAPGVNTARDTAGRAF